jgi:pyruvate dehydrogenase E2 component (dihydrolipoamide acetyltransferase)
MSERVTMPALGESVTEGTVTRWLKNVGDRIEVDEPLLEVSTDKVDTEIPSPVAGTLQEVLVQEDETVEVGADLAVVGDDEGGSGDGGESGGAEQSAEPEAGEEPSGEGPTGEEPSGEEPTGEEPSGEGPSGEEPSGEEPSGGAPEASGEESGGPPEASGEESAEAGDAGGGTSAGESDSGSGGGGGGGTTVPMPALGESVTEGTVTRWLKAEGDEVEVDEPLLEVSTDKVDTEIPSPVAGTLTSILVQEDETVEVGADLAVVDGASGGEAGRAAAAAPESEETQQEAPQQEAPQQEEPEPSAEKEPEEAGPAEPAPAETGASDTGAGAEGASTATAPAPPSGPTGAPDADGGADRGDASSYVTPLVRKLASDKGVDLASLTGTGVGGRIRKQDVLDAAAKKEEPAPAEPREPAEPKTPRAPAAASTVDTAKRGTREKMPRLRRLIAQRMVESLQVSAQLTTVVEVDMTKVVRTRQRAKAEFERREGVKLSVLPFLALATVEALKVHPNLNASVEGDEVIYHGEENLSIAVDTEKGLIVPVVKNAGDLNIAGLARSIADLAERTRSNSITPDDLAGGTFTITNTGSRGALFDTPILNQPQVGMLGTGTIVKRPVVVTDADGGETIAIRSMMYLALTYDHRIVDGADAARFLTTIKDRLEEGEFEASLGL